ncbi:YqgE/AlgH family protein [Desertimonas flava]|uniref:YqgE/AlgH family protein n=1 Tax=Desertimonas flava TaxID=2064846 RepID=UPI000E34D617|nr:YqgE/AlgH family protein [Desertimonas flava]
MVPGTSIAKGRLLVATPVLDDPNFARTVVYIVEHHDDGALGLVLNRPSYEQLDDPLDRWVDVQSSPPRVFSGGPVEPDALIALARTKQPAVPPDPTTDADEDDEDTYLAPLSGTIASADLAADPALVAGSIDGLRVFRGYAGWSPGQLEMEIGTGSWLVVDSVESDIFTDEPDELWRVVLRRQPGRLGWLAEAPDDLSWN